MEFVCLSHEGNHQYLVLRGDEKHKIDFVFHHPGESSF